MASEAERQKALSLLFGEEVQEALKLTEHVIVREAFALGDPAAIKNYAATMQQLAQAREWLARGG